MVGNRDDAEDIVQDALLKAHRSLASFRADSSLKTWLFSITTRGALDHLRAAKRWRTQALVDACDARGAASMQEKFGDASVTFDVSQHIAFCFTCVGRSLTPEHHAALVLREFFHLENAEAAAVLDMTEPKYRHALADARAAMQREYEGLCALVKKEGPCYQCRALRELAPAPQKGPPLPTQTLSFEERLRTVVAAHDVAKADQRLNDYFFGYVRQLHPKD